MFTALAKSDGLKIVMKLFVAGLSYKTAPVELREKLAVHRSRLQCSGCRLRLRGGLSEVVLLSTCNRVEIYGVTPNFHANLAELFQELADDRSFDFSPYIYLKEGLDAAEHLFSVASGLDSLVLGETEITGQVKHAYQSAQAAGLTGKRLNRAFQSALSVAKSVRTETGIGRGATSVGSVAVDLAEKIFDADLSAKTVMIIGAGKMGEACVKHLAKRGAKSVLVSNRSRERAEKLAAEFGGRAVGVEESRAALIAADIVVTSTSSPDYVLTRADIEPILAERGNRPLILVDIAVPRDVDPALQQLPNVFLYDIDDLEAIVRENTKHRAQELAQCHAIIHRRASELLARISPVPDRILQPQFPSLPEWLFAVRPGQLAAA